MTPTHFTAFSDAGCMIIFDPASGFEVTEEWLHCVNHVADPDGRTNLTCDYPEGTWPMVWQRHFQRLDELSQKGEFVLLLCDEIDYECQVTRCIAEQEARRTKAKFEEAVHAPSGKLVFGDVMSAYSGEAMQDDPLAIVAVTPGWNMISIYHLSEHDALPHIEGFEGTPDHPALVFVITPCDQCPTPEAERIALPRIHTRGERVPNALCEAQVISINDQRAKLQLMTSRSVRSGHGRLTVPESIRLKVGDIVRVRLLEQKKAYWTVELA